MAGGKHKIISNRNQGYLASLESNYPTIASSGYTTTPEKQDTDLKTLLMMIMEDFKKDINNSLKEIQENKGKQVETLKEETQKFLNELQETTTKLVKELNKTIQDLKMEIETIKKSQKRQPSRKPRKEIRSHRCKHHQKNAKDRREKNLSGKDTKENIDTTVKENAKCKKLLTQNIQEIQNTMRRPNIRILV